MMQSPSLRIRGARFDDDDRQLGADSSKLSTAQSSASAKQRPVASNAELGVDLVRWP